MVADVCETQAGGEFLRPEAVEGGLGAGIGEEERRPVDEEVVELALLDEEAQDLRSSLEIHAGDAGFGAALAEVGEAHPLGGRFADPDLDAEFAKLADVAHAAVLRRDDDRPLVEFVGVDPGQVLVHDRAQAAVKDEADGTPFGGVRGAGGEPGIVPGDRACAGGDRGKEPAPAVDVGPGRLSGDPLRLAGAGGDPAVESHGRLGSQERAPVRDCVVENEVQVRAFHLENAGLDLDAGLAEDFEAAAGMLGIGIGCSDDHPADAGADDGLRAGSRSAFRGAGLESHVEDGARLGGAAQGGQGGALGMGAAVLRMVAVGCNAPGFHDHGPDHGIGMCRAPAFPRQVEGAAHEGFVGFVFCHGWGAQTGRT